MVKHTVKKIGVLSVFKTFLTVGLIVGALLGLFLSVMFSSSPAGVLGFEAPSTEPPTGLFSPASGLLSGIIGGLFYGLAVAILGSLGAALYNVAAGVVGGIELELEQPSER